MTTPYIGFSNNTLAGLAPLKAGDKIKCPICGQWHPVVDSVPPMMLYYQCGSKSFMAGLNGRNTMGTKADCSGKIP